MPLFPLVKRELRLGGGYKVLSTFVWMVILALIWGGMYLGYNEVGNYLITGFQGRYLIPIAFLIATSLENKHFSVDKVDWDIYLYPLIGFVNLYSLILVFTQMSNCY